jgi:hypothetical protein
MELLKVLLALPVLVCFLLSLLVFSEFLSGYFPLVQGLWLPILANGLIPISILSSLDDHNDVLPPKFSQNGKVLNVSKG